MRFSTLLGAIALCFGAACIRSTDEIPQLGEGAFVNGIVVERDTTSGEVRGLEGARVSAVGISISATTDQRGFFQLQRLPLGRLKIRIEKRAQGGRPALGRSLDPLNALVEGQTIDLGEIELLPSGGLSGFVGTRVEGVFKPTAASGALVVGAQTTFKAIAGEDGNYLLSGLPEGLVDLVAFYPQHDPARVTGVEVTAGIRKTVEDLVLSPSTGATEVEISGVAKLQGQNESSGISVKFIDESMPANPSIDAVTNNSGAYAVTLPFGVYRARFSKDGYVPVEIAGVAVLKEGVVGLASVLLGAVTSGDLDGDGIADGQDPDRDNDGCPNTEDQFPDDVFSCTDTDGDMLADELDPDDDGDGLNDPEELSPGRDGFITDPLRDDTDGDGFKDFRVNANDPPADNCPTIANPGQEDALPETPRGDACEDDAVIVTPPMIDHLEPASGKVGDLVMIVGSSFMSGVPSLVRFGDGAIAATRSVAPTRILVEVPAGAETGTITVYLPNGIASKADAFTFRPAPEVTDFEPRIARKATIVAVIGKYFIPDNIEAFVNGIEAEILSDAMGRPIIEDYFRDREPRKLIRIRVPDTVTGPIRVSTADGFGDSPTPLTISGGPTILEARPNPVLELQQLLINGTGFSTIDTGGDVMVKFEGIANPTAVEFRTDTSIRVVVPMGAQTGYFYVVHPAGMPRSPDVLTIGGDVSYVSLIEPSLAKEGEAIQLRGAGLTGATLVRFGNATATPNASSTATHVDVVVPAGAGAGPLEVTLPGGPLITAVPFRKYIVSTPMVASSGAGVGYSSNGANIYVVSGSNGNTYDATTLAAVDTVALSITGNPNGFQVAPDGTWGVISMDFETTTYVISLPDFSPLFTCSHGPRALADFVGGIPGAAFRFDDSSEKAFISDPTPVSASEDGVLVIDRYGLSCTVVAQAPEPTATSDFRGILSLNRSDLLVADAERGVGVISVDPNVLFGQIISPFQGAGVPQTRLFWAPGNAYVLALGPGLWRIDPTGSTPPAVIDSNVQLEGALSSDHRWLSASGKMFDVEAGRFARPNIDFLSNRGVAWHPVRNELMAADLSNNLTRVQIIEN